MDLAKPGEIKYHCHPNALSTFLEYLCDYAGPQAKSAGEKLISIELQHMDGQQIACTLPMLNKVRARRTRCLCLERRGRKPRHERATAKGIPAAYRLLRTPQRRQIEPAERHYAAEGFDRVGRAGHDDRPGREADGAASHRTGAVCRYGGRGRRGRAGRAAHREDAPGHRALRYRRAGYRSRRVERVRGEASGRVALARNSGARRLEQGRPAARLAEQLDAFEQEKLPFVELAATTGEGTWTPSAQSSRNCARRSS